MRPSVYVDGLASDTNVCAKDLTLDSYDNLYFIDTSFIKLGTELKAVALVEKIDPSGNLFTIAGFLQGDGNPGYEIPARGARLSMLANGGHQINKNPRLDMNGQGDLVLIDPDSGLTRARVIKLGGASGYFDNINLEYELPSNDGDKINVFHGDGRQKEIRDALTGATLFSFKYMDLGVNSRLISITEHGSDPDPVVTSDDKVTEFVYGVGSDKPTSIIAPNGVVTTLTMVNDRLTGLSAQFEGSGKKTWGFGYQDGTDLLTNYKDARGEDHVYQYDQYGKLVKDSAPEFVLGKESFIELFKDESTNIITKKVSTGSATDAIGVLETTYESGTYTDEVNDEDNGSFFRVTFPTGLSNESLSRKDGSTRLTMADGTVIETKTSGDPFWGMLKPFTSERKILSSRANKIVTTSKSILPANAANVEDITTITKQTTEQYQTEAGSVSDTSSSVYTSSDNTWRHTTPQQRQRYTTLDPMGRMQAWGFGEPGNSSEYAETTLEYTPDGKLESITTSDNTESRQYTYAYNAQGDLASISDPMGRTTTFTGPIYNSVGESTVMEIMPSVDLGGGNIQDIVTATTYDPEGNMISLNPPGNMAPVHDLSYNAIGFIEEYLPPDVTGAKYETKYAYTLDKKLKLVTRPDDYKIEYVYHPNGQLWKLVEESNTNIKSDMVTYRYSGTTGKLTETSTDRIKIENSESNDSDFRYESIKTLDLMGSSDANFSNIVLYTYNNKSDLVGISINDDVEMEFDYDSDSLLTKAGLVGGASMEYVRGETTDVGGKSEYQIDHSGNIRSTNFVVGAGVVESTHDFNAFGDIQEDTYTRNSTESLYDVNYKRDLQGRILCTNEVFDGSADSVTTYYEYDELGRLTHVRKTAEIECKDIIPTDNLVSRYSYDENGNRMLFEDYRGGTSITYSGEYDQQDRITEYGVDGDRYEYTYTLAGELKSKTLLDDQGVPTSQRLTYFYDLLGNLVRVTSVNNFNAADDYDIEYIIDGQNRRIGRIKTQNGAETVQGFIYKDGLNPIAETDGQQIVATYVYGSKPNVPDFMNKLVDGVWKTYRIISNHLGSPVRVIDVESGEIAQSMTYDAFGRILEDSVEGFHFQLFGFAGGLYDPDTGLVRFGVRDYDPEIGRWTAKDPIRFDGGDANLYGYVVSDPVNYIDSDGKFSRPSPWTRPIIAGVVLFTYIANELWKNFGPEFDPNAPGPLGPKPPPGSPLGPKPRYPAPWWTGSSVAPRMCFTPTSGSR